MNRLCTAVIAEVEGSIAICNQPGAKPVYVLGAVPAVFFFCEKHMVVHNADATYWKNRAEKSREDLKQGRKVAVISFGVATFLISAFITYVLLMVKLF